MQGGSPRPTNQIESVMTRAVVLIFAEYLGSLR